MIFVDCLGNNPYSDLICLDVSFFVNVLIIKCVVCGMKLFIRRLSELNRYVKEPFYKNSFFLLLNNGSGAVLGFVFWVVAARFYPPEEVGVASALIAAMMLLATLSRLGFDMGIIRFLPAEADKKGMINSCLTVTGLASLIMCLIFVAGLDFWSPALSFIRKDIPFMIVFIGFTVAFTLSIMLSGTFVAFRRAEFSFSQNMIVCVLRVALPVVAVSAGVFGLFFSWGIGLCLATAISLFLFLPRLQPMYRPVPKIKKSTTNDMVRFSFMNYAVGLLQGIPTYVLPLIIINIFNSATTAYFRIAWAIAGTLFLTVPVAVSTSLFAEGSHYPERLRMNAFRAAVLMLALVIPGIIILFFLGDKILLLFGTAYSENGLRAMQILSLASIPAIFLQLYLVTRMVQMRMKPVILVVALNVASALGMIYALLPRWGLIGVSIGWSSGQTIVMLLVGVILLIQKLAKFKAVI